MTVSCPYCGTGLLERDEGDEPVQEDTGKYHYVSVCREYVATSRDAYRKDAAKAYGLLARAIDLLHDIGGNYYARRALKQTNLTAPLRASMQDKALTDEQIEKLCLDNWEHIATEIHARPLPSATEAMAGAPEGVDVDAIGGHDVR